MLDSLFSTMHADGFATWKIHGRLHTKRGEIDFTAPHALADGRMFLRDVAQPLVEFAGPENLTSAPDAVSIRMSFESGPLTRFQQVLSYLLNERRFVSCERIAVAVSIAGDPLVEGQRNQVAFPIFEREELQRLLSTADWKQTLRFRALRECEAYRTWSAILRDKTPETRIRLLARAPLQKADLVVSYWGDLTRLLGKAGSASNSLSFGVTATNGPSQILILHRDQIGFRGLVTSKAQSLPQWSEDVIRLEAE